MAHQHSGGQGVHQTLHHRTSPPWRKADTPEGKRPHLAADLLHTSRSKLLPEPRKVRPREIQRRKQGRHQTLLVSTLWFRASELHRVQVRPADDEGGDVPHTAGFRSGARGEDGDSAEDLEEKLRLELRGRLLVRTQKDQRRTTYTIIYCTVINKNNIFFNLLVFLFTLSDSVSD